VSKPVHIFYSWQSDAPANTNRSFIEKALAKAIKQVKGDTELHPALRDTDIHLDKDTKGVSGSPPIAQTILAKIDNCSAFVGDITFVGKSLPKLGFSKKRSRLFPNPNVLIEYGYAIAARGHTSVITVMNTAFGECTQQTLPFDLQHLRWPITYTLESADSPDKKIVFDGLVKDLTAALKAILNQPNEDLPVLAAHAIIAKPSPNKGLTAIITLQVENSGHRSLKSLATTVTHDETHCVAFQHSGDWVQAPHDSSVNPRLLRYRHALNPGDKSLIMRVPLCERSVLPFHVCIQITAEDCRPTKLYCELTADQISRGGVVAFGANVMPVSPAKDADSKLHLPASSLAKEILELLLEHPNLDERGLTEITGPENASDSCFVANSAKQGSLCSAPKRQFKAALDELIQSGWLLPSDLKDRVRVYTFSPEAHKS